MRKAWLLKLFVWCGNFSGLLKKPYSFYFSFKPTVKHIPLSHCCSYVAAQSVLYTRRWSHRVDLDPAHSPNIHTLVSNNKENTHVCNCSVNSIHQSHVRHQKSSWHFFLHLKKQMLMCCFNIQPPVCQVHWPKNRKTLATNLFSALYAWAS